MKILAIESSCDDTAAALVEDGRKVLSSLTSSQINDHKIFGGVVPEVASRKHIENISPLVKCVMEEAGLSFSDLEAIAVTYAPGLVGSLLVGVNFAKGISIATELPIVPVHHIKSHIIEVRDYTDFRILGKTRDDAAGEAFDKIGRRLGFDYPGGVMLDKVAESGNPNAFALPVPLKNEDKTYDFSFSGLKTAMINIINGYNQKNIPLPKEDISATFRKSVVDCLVNNFISAAKDFGYTNLAIAGGVSANSLLRTSLEKECKKRNWKFFKPELKYCGDNGAMVGAQAYYEFLSGKRAGLNLNAKASMSIEQD